MSRVVELYGYSVAKPRDDWTSVVGKQACPFLGKRCFKTRKSNSEISIGSCTVLYGAQPEPVIICPARLLERRQIFTDCLHLLKEHEPGNELHILSEVSIPGGSVDYFVVSVKNGKIKDFVGIELQTLDTTGTVWPARQKTLIELGLAPDGGGENSTKSYGMNWKMTAKTILMQMHHKIQTFEHLDKHLVLVVQDKLLKYMSKEFSFEHLKNPPARNDSVRLHAYTMKLQSDGSLKLALSARLGTDADGIGQCLGLFAEARVELEEIIRSLQGKISAATMFTPF